MLWLQKPSKHKKKKHKKEKEERPKDKKKSKKKPPADDEVAEPLENGALHEPLPVRALYFLLGASCGRLSGLRRWAGGP